MSDGKVIMNELGQELRRDDVWHVRIGASLSTKTCKLLNVSHYMVQLMEVPFSYLKPWHELATVKFIEKVSGDEPKD